MHRHRCPGDWIETKTRQHANMHLQALKTSDCKRRPHRGPAGDGAFCGLRRLPTHLNGVGAGPSGARLPSPSGPAHMLSLRTLPTPALGSKPVPLPIHPLGAPQGPPLTATAPTEPETRSAPRADPRLGGSNRPAGKAREQRRPGTRPRAPLGGGPRKGPQTGRRSRELAADPGVNPPSNKRTKTLVCG